MDGPSSLHSQHSSASRTSDLASEGSSLRSHPDRVHRVRTRHFLTSRRSMRLHAGNDATISSPELPDMSRAHPGWESGSLSPTGGDRIETFRMPTRRLSTPSSQLAATEVQVHIPLNNTAVKPVSSGDAERPATMSPVSVVGPMPAFSGSATQVRQTTLELMTNKNLSRTSVSSNSSQPTPRGAHTDFYMPMELNDMLEEAMEKDPTSLRNSTFVKVHKDNVTAEKTANKAPTIQSNKVRLQQSRREMAVNSAMASRVDLGVEENAPPERMKKKLSGASSCANLDANDIAVGRVGREEVSDVLSQLDHAVAGHPELDQRFLYDKLHKVAISEPSLVYQVHGRDWSKEIFAVYHNAVRREMMDLYYILGSLNKRQYFLEREEISLFMRWFDLFHWFVVCMLRLDEAVILSWVEASSAPLEGPMAQDRRSATRREINEQLEKVATRVDETRIQSVPPGELFSVITQSINEFSRILLRYFSDAVRVVGPAIKESQTPESVHRQSMEIAKWVRGVERSHEILELLVRWTGQNTIQLKRDLLDAYKSVGSPASKMLGPLAQRQRKKGKETLARNHTGLVQQFYDRWKDFESQSMEKGVQQLRIAAPYMV